MVAAVGKLLARKRMRIVAASLLSVGLCGGQALPPGLIRGTLQHAVEDGNAFQLRTAAGLVFDFRFDARTWIERDGERIPGRNLMPGEMIEVVCDRENAAVHYARTIHEMPQRAGFVATRRARHVVAMAKPVTFSGSVVSLDNDSMRLRIRQHGVRQFRLRDDTHYMKNGDSVERGQLTPNTRVFIRGAINEGGAIEVYAVIWGDIRIVQ